MFNLKFFFFFLLELRKFKFPFGAQVDEWKRAFPHPTLGASRNVLCSRVLLFYRLWISFCRFDNFPFEVFRFFFFVFSVFCDLIFPIINTPTISTSTRFLKLNSINLLQFTPFQLILHTIFSWFFSFFLLFCFCLSST